MRRLSGWMIVLLLAGLWLTGPGFGQEKKEDKKEPAKAKVKAEPKPTQVRVLLPQDNTTLTIEGAADQADRLEPAVRLAAAGRPARSIRTS